MIKFKKGDRVKAVRPEPFETELYGEVGTVMELSQVPFVNFDKFGKIAMMQSQLELFKEIKLENK